jgi:hypothetical protein
MDDLKPNETAEFLWRRLAEECPMWAIGVPVLFGVIVVALIAWFRPEKRLKAAIVGGAIVGALSAIYLPMAFILRPFFSWLVILLPMMAVALFYVGLMYRRDAKSVHPLWASFLGLLRCCVYMTLAVVFLLPGCQHFEKQEYEPKVLILFDVSASMLSKDDLPEKGQDLATLPTRQDKIVSFLFDQHGGQPAFLERVAQKTPVTMYRFGSVLDDGDIISLSPKKDKTIDDAKIKKWLKPSAKDFPKPNVEGLKEDEVKEKLAKHAKQIDLIDALLSGTNIGGACLSAHKLENSSYLQAILVISDGQFNLGTDEDGNNFKARTGNPKRPIPVFTIGVGQFRQPAGIRIDDILAPEETRPDDKFSVRVPVVGTGLHDKPFEVTLEVKRVKDVTGRPVQEAPHILGPKPGKFKGAGDHPQGDVAFEIDVQDLKKIRAADDKTGELEGEWQIEAIVPRDESEPFPEPFHKSEPVKVVVQKRALRVLLFAGGATREYQFLRTILYREMTEKRMEMCIYLQTGREDHIDQDVEPERMLSEFPNKLGPDDPGQKYMSLNDYDVIVAFDPDWSRLSTRQLKLMEDWVGDHAGGVIFVAGPVYTYQLARPGGRDITSLLKIFPVVLKDSRLHSLSLGGGLSHDATRPYALHFTPTAQEYDFLKLDDESDSPIAGWNKFFWNRDDVDPQEVAGARPKRGFFTYYPVERIKANSEVVATFAGPKESRINGGKDEQPFIVRYKFGQGHTLYLGSGEFWRLRSYKDGYQDRFWIKAARNVASTSTLQKKQGRILLARNLPVGQINFEAQVKGKDLLPLPRDLRPTVLVKRIDKNKDDKAEMQKFDLQPKPLDDEEWKGYFIGHITIKEPGEYEFQLPIPNSPETLRATLTVRKPNPELDNVRTNFGYLHLLASEARDLLKTLPAETRREIEPLLQVPQDSSQSNEKASKRLFFPLQSADAIAKCLVPLPPKTEIVKGRFEDLWDGGVKTERVVNAFWATLLAPIVLGLFGAFILLIVRQYLNALVFLGICVLVSVAIGVADSFFMEYLVGEKGELPVHFSYLLMLIVGLLGIEWLARKLLRLA